MGKRFYTVSARYPWIEQIVEAKLNLIKIACDCSDSQSYLVFGSGLFRLVRLYGLLGLLPLCLWESPAEHNKTDQAYHM